MHFTLFLFVDLEFTDELRKKIVVFSVYLFRLEHLCRITKTTSIKYQIAF